MTHIHFHLRPARLLWVGVIAFVASVLVGWFRWDSALISVALGLASAVISMAIVWFVDWSRR